MLFGFFKRCWLLLMQATSRKTRHAHVIIFCATRKDNNTDQDLVRTATLNDSSDTEAAGTHSPLATSSQEQPADGIELSAQQASLSPLAKVVAAAVLISPFFFWGTSMVGMKVRFGLGRHMWTICGALTGSFLFHLPLNALPAACARTPIKPINLCKI